MYKHKKRAKSKRVVARLVDATTLSHDAPGKLWIAMSRLDNSERMTSWGSVVRAPAPPSTRRC